MKQVTRTQAFLRKRKMLLVLPLLALPFVTLAFWALGGGKTKEDMITTNEQGLNLHLPGTQLKGDSSLNKLSFYEKARSDSQKLTEWMRSDPYYKDTSTAGGLSFRDDNALLLSAGQPQKDLSAYAYQGSYSLNPSPYKGSTYENSAEEKVMQKLAQLNDAIQKPQEVKKGKVEQEPANTFQSSNDAKLSGDIERLESMIHQVSGKGEEDPELQQLSFLMDKIMDIQHPERVKERTREASLIHKAAVYPIHVDAPSVSISLLSDRNTISGKEGAQASRFFGLEKAQNAAAPENAVMAVVHGTQSLSRGSVVKLRLEQNIYVGGQLIPKGSFIYGISEINNERLHISITSIRYGSAIYPVKLQVYDLDGIAGIYMPGTAGREVIRHSADNTLQSLELSAIDPSLKVQAVGAGINAAKNLLSKKIKVEKVTLKAGYQVLLKSSS